MANEFFTPSGYPAPNAPGASASMRAELDLIEAGFDKLPALTGNANKLVSVNDTGTALVANDDITQIDFDTAGGGDAVARLVWNDTDGTLNLGLKGGNVVLQVGQETVLRAYNNTGSAMTDGQVVYINASSGQRPTIALAQANAEATSTKVLGVVTEPISNNAEGFVSTDGLVRGLNTLTLTEGAVVWLSDSVAGGLTTTKPTAPNHAVMIGYCVKSHGTQGILYVKVQNGYELDELHDVLISGLAANNMLRYDGSLWRNIAGPAGDVVGTTDSQTLTNKTISGGTVTGAVVTGLASPTNTSDAATKGYVDSVTEGLDVKASVRVATTANITLSGTQTIDGVSVIAGDRVLVKNQTATAENGIYVVAAGAWSRSSDANAWAELVSAFTFVEVGTTQAGNGYICTVAAGGTLGVTAVTFSQFSSAGQLQPGAGLTRAGNTLDVVTASSSRIVVNADNIDLATTGVSAGTYRSLTVDAYGRATGGTNPTTIAGYGITDAYTKTYIDTLYGDTASAAASAAAAAASYDAFDDRWLGAKASDPTLDNDGNALQTGAVYFSTTAQEMRVYNGTTWQTATTLPNGVFQNAFTATAGQTTYAWTGGTYNPSMLYIYVNGVLLSSTEYTATDGTNISFSTGLTLSDEVRLLTFKAAGTITAADVAAVAKAGDTMTGPLVVNAASASGALRITQTGAGNALVVSDGNVVAGHTAELSVSGGTPQLQNHSTSASGSLVSTTRWAETSGSGAFVLAHSRGAIIGTFSPVVAGDNLGLVSFQGSGTTTFASGATIAGQADSGTFSDTSMPGRLVFSTTPSGSATPVERLRIDSSGAVGIGTSTLTGYSLRVNDTTTSIGGAATKIITSSQGQLQSDVTSGFGFHTALATAAGSYTVSSISNYYANGVSVGSGSTVTNQYGYRVHSSLNTATNNYGFYGEVAAAAGRWNFYAAGTAANYFAGETTINSGLTIGRTAVTSPAASDGNVFSGTYTPTLTNSAGISQSTAYICQYMRVGNVVTVSGVLGVTTTGTGSQTVGISLPIASTFTGVMQAGGSGTFYGTTFRGTAAAIYADSANARATFNFNSPSAASGQSATFTFTYRIL